MPRRPKAKIPTVRLPHNWQPRPYQVRAFEAFDAGKRDQMHIWHRRAGKDAFEMNLTAIQAHREIGTYWHVLPYQVQARRALWYGMDRNGVRFIDQAFPPELRSSLRDNEMMIDFRCGSTWQLVGSDNFNALVGSNPRGVVFSEFALQDPRAHDYIRPILAENGGWRHFITTYRGKNHAYQMYEQVKTNPEWFCSLLTVDDTTNWDGSPVISPTDIERERAEGMDESMIRQEYYCDPTAAFTGSFYARELERMKMEGRMTAVEHDPRYPVYASWDLGWVDHMTAVFVQPVGNRSNIVGSRSWRMTTIPDALDDIRRTYPWEVDTHVLPWDADGGKGRDLNTGTTWRQSFEDRRTRTDMAPKTGKQEGIDAVRLWLPTVWIDIERRPFASDGNNLLLIESLTGYRTELAKGKPGVFQLTPAHTWESHLADAARYYAVWRASGGLENEEWGRAPDYAEHDRAVI